MNADAKKIFKVGLFSLFFLFIIVYAFFTSKDLIFGVKIINVNIVDGAKMTENVLEI